MRNETLLETKEYKGFEIEVHQDENSNDPREWDSFGTMICFHGRYNLGDKHNLKSDNFDGWDEVEKHLIENENAFIILPLFLYDHSGITISTTPFGCRWDSGQVGFIYVTKEKIKEEFNTKKITKSIKEKAKNILISEIKIYDEYLRGEVYGFIVKDTGGEEIDSCWGFFGDREDMIEEAKGSIDYEIERRNNKADLIQSQQLNKFLNPLSV